MYISQTVKYILIFLWSSLVLHFAILFISVLFTRYNTENQITHPYRTDGCTLYVDGDYSDCCEAHDHAYWQWWPIYKKLLADATLYACIAEKWHNFRENWMFAWVLFGWNPWLPTDFRWGFGYPYPYYNIQK